MEDKVFAMLKLSYDHLSSDLKNCFGYCSLFPKYFETKRKEIIQLWAAQGFILSDGSRRVEDIGDEYFMKLLSMCLFQDVQLDEHGEISTCKMHHLIHDLSRLVTKNEYFVVDEGKDKIWGDKMRHLSFEFQYDWKFPTSVVNGGKIRTILSPISNIEIIPSHLPPLLSLYERVGGSAISFPRRLRVLTTWYNSSHRKIPFLRKIPKSISKLKHLRYLDLSGNGYIRKLPQGITKLHNLQTLKLNDCWSLKELSRDINEMVSLRHLEFDSCFGLRWMPLGLGQLTHLQTLTEFIVDNRFRNDCAKISELRGLNSLSGVLMISRLEQQRNNTKEIESAKLLIDKSYLRELKLKWSIHKVKENEQEQIGYKDEMILEALEPPHTIKILDIAGFIGKRLPDWISNLTSLLKLKLYGCCALESPIGNLTSLQEFALHSCDMLVSLPDFLGHLASLKVLRFTHCSTLSSLPESMENLTLLEALIITSCHVLTSLPEGIRNLVYLQTMEINDCPLLKERYGKEGGEDWPKIAHIPRVLFSG